MQNHPVNPVPNPIPNETTRLITNLSDSPLMASNLVCIWVMHALHHSQRTETTETYRGKLIVATTIAACTVAGYFMVKNYHPLSTQIPITNTTAANISSVVDAAATGISHLAESTPSFFNMIFDQVANVSPETMVLASTAIAAGALMYTAGDDVKQSVANSVTLLTESGYSLFRKAVEFAGYSTMPAKVPSFTV